MSYHRANGIFLASRILQNYRIRFSYLPRVLHHFDLFFTYNPIHFIFIKKNTTIKKKKNEYYTPMHQNKGFDSSIFDIWCDISSRYISLTARAKHWSGSHIHGISCHFLLGVALRLYSIYRYYSAHRKD